jgi:hypothetical protein
MDGTGEVRRHPLNLREAHLGYGKASEYVTHDDIKQGDLVIPVCRVSTWEQEHDLNLSDQERSMRQEMERRGAVVIDVIRHVGSGWDTAWLAEAADIARRRGAKLVAESLSRFIRSPDDHSKKKPQARPSWQDLDQLRLATVGVELVTLLDPDATPGEERSYQTSRGQSQKGNRGGRPPAKRPGAKKARRKQLLRFVDADSDNGLSIRAIATKYRLAPSTVHLWIKSLAN